MSSTQTSDEKRNGGVQGNQKALEAMVDTEEDMKWGLLCCTPSWMQWVNRPQIVILCICWFTLLQGFVVNGVNNVNTSSLERRFNLPSSLVSLVSSAYDISAGLVVLPLTFLLGRAHYPRMLALASLSMSLGSLTMSLPHFTSPPYDLVGSVADKCDVIGNGTDALCAKQELGLSNYLYVFMLGQFLHGLGGACIYSLGVVYIDNNVHTESSPVYTGFNFACSALGPAIGYIVGGRMLRNFVDFDTRDTSNLGITPDDPRWVGAWWVCFFVACFLFLTVFLMLIPYPRETPNAREVRLKRVSMAHNDGSEEVAAQEGFGTKLRDLPMALWILLKNPVNMFMTGLMAVPGAAGGQFVGGLIARLLKLKVRGMIRMCLILSSICVLCGFSLLINCGRENVAGVKVAYGNRSVELDHIQMTSSCNAECNCKLYSYEPICGTDNIQYFSPCHAGCRNSYRDISGKKVYTDCSCIPAPNATTVVASDGKCSSNCTLLSAFLPFFFLITFLTFVGTVPGVMASLRCIPDNQRTLGLGFKWVFIRFCGTVPGPIIFGLLYDSTCILWQDKCSEKGSCWIYENNRLSVALFLFCSCIKLCSTIFFFLANLFYKPPPETDVADVGKLNTGFQNGKMDVSTGSQISADTRL